MKIFSFVLKCKFQVVDIMKTNVEKVLERDQKLSELDDRADALQQGASQFEQQAGKLKRKFWLQNLKVSFLLFHIIFFYTKHSILQFILRKCVCVCVLRQ